MNITVQVTQSPQLNALLRGSQIVAGYAVMQVAGEAVADYLRAYHGKMDWRGGGWMSPSLGFAGKVVGGWQAPVTSANSVTITNTFGLLKHKVTGGPITPQRAKFLTIPLVSAAKGKTVSEFRASDSTPLFRAGMALCQRLGGKVTAIYALSRGVTQSPWPGALPTNDALAGVFTAAAQAYMTRSLERAA